MVSTRSARLISNRDLVLFALYERGGAESYVVTEHVAHQVFQHPLGKQRYRWEHYEDYPDKERIARELRRLKNVKGAPLVEGHINVGSKKDRVDGWRLTAAGVDRVKAIREELVATLGATVGSHHKYQETALRRRITSTSCYKAYLKDSTMMTAAKDHEFTDMLYCLPDAPSERVITAYNQLMTSAMACGAQDIVQFLQVARRRFAAFFDK